MNRLLQNSLAAFILSGCAAATLHASDVVFPGADWQTSPPEAQGLSSENLTKAIDYLGTILGKDGVSQVVLIRNGYLLWAGDDIDNRHLVWSCTKSFTSICLGLLWDDGKCQPGDLISKYLPELAQDYPDVTLEHLATFTSGVNLKRGELTPGKPDYPVGTAIHYSSQSDLLAQILTQLAGESLKDLFQRRIGDPIGMRPDEWEWKSVHVQDGVAINGGAGMPESGVEISARAMARIGWLFAHGGNWNGQQLISKRYIDYATVSRVDPGIPPFNPKAFYKVLPGRYGLNWWVNGVNANGKRLWPHLPASTFAAQGNMNNICIIAPEKKMVLVRLAQDEIIDVGLFDGFFERLLAGSK